jgi:HEAT repeat protein
MFQDEDPAVRLKAVRRAGELRDAQAAPYLVDRLTDSEPEVRFFAILALERIAGTRLGYAYYAPAGEREQAVQRWRRWLAERRQQDKAAATQPTEGSSS